MHTPPPLDTNRSFLKLQYLLEQFKIILSVIELQNHVSVTNIMS